MRCLAASRLELRECGPSTTTVSKCRVEARRNVGWAGKCSEGSYHGCFSTTPSWTDWARSSPISSPSSATSLWRNRTGRAEARNTGREFVDRNLPKRGNAACAEKYCISPRSFDPGWPWQLAAFQWLDRRWCRLQQDHPIILPDVVGMDRDIVAWNFSSEHSHFHQMLPRMSFCCIRGPRMAKEPGGSPSPGAHIPHHGGAVQRFSGGSCCVRCPIRRPV